MILGMVSESDIISIGNNPVTEIPYCVKGRPVGEVFKKNAHVLLVHIHSLCQRKAGACVATTKYLGKIIGKSERQVTYYIKYLKDTGQINIHTSNPIKNSNFRKNPRLFYKKRIIQSKHDHHPDYYQEVNNIHFSDLSRKEKSNEIKSLVSTMVVNVKTHEKLVDYKGRPLNPKRVGYETPEYFESTLPPVVASTTAVTSSPPALSPAAFVAVRLPKPAQKQEEKIDVKKLLEDTENDPGYIEFMKNRRPPPPPDDLDEYQEPEEGNELRDLLRRLNKKRQTESDSFWDSIQDGFKETVEEEKPLDYHVKLNLINPYTKKPL